MIYRLPEARDEQLLREYVREHHDYGETVVTASMGLQTDRYSEWVEKIHVYAVSGDQKLGKNLLLLCLNEGRLIGLLSIRYELTKELTEVYGDIGYGVRPAERKKGYATQMLRHALDICREKGMRSVVLGCFRDNLASATTIRKNGGVLIAENDNYQKGKISQYYSISL